MATSFVNIDRDTPLLLPPDLRDWVPADHLAQFGQITVSLDGTRLAANVSKHAAVSDERGGQRLEQARVAIEARAKARYAVEWAEHEKKLAARLTRQQRGEKPRGPGPTPPALSRSRRTNTTSPIPKAGS
jgi:hypothetical protein